MSVHLDPWRLIRRRPARTVAAVALATATVAGGVSVFAAGTDSTGAPSAEVRVGRGEVTAAVAARGAVQPAANRTLAFTADGTVVEVRVRPGDEVSAGQELAVVDDGDVRAEVDRARQVLAEAEETLAELEDAGETDCVTGVVDREGAGGTSGTRIIGVAATAGGAGGGRSVAGTVPTGSGSATPATHRPSVPPVTPSPEPTVTASVTPPAVDQGTPTPAAPSGPDSSGGRPSSTADPHGCSAGGTGDADPLLRAHQQVTAARLALAAAQDRLAGTTITAPLPGRVLAVAGPVGTLVRAGGRFIDLAVVDGMQVAASFPEADAGRIAVGQPAAVSLASSPETELAAEVVQVDPVGTAEGQVIAFGVRIAFAEPPANLLIGQTVAVRVEIATVRDVLRLPIGAVRGEPDDSGVVRLVGAAEPHPVILGIRGDRFVEIRAGLTEGDRVLAAM